MNFLVKARIGFIGAGKVGVTLGAYFKSKGICVVGYASKSAKSAQKAAETTATRVFHNMSNLVDECNIIFITTPDDQIRLVWNELAMYNIKGYIICHTSGSLSSDIFSAKTAHCAFGYSIHPIFAFTTRNGVTTGLEHSHFAVEGDAERLNDVISLLSSLGNKTISIDKSKKTLYHLANVMVSNLVLSLLSIGDECMNECGIDSRNSMEALMPLIISNIENIKHTGFVSSLTGPIERNDVGTVHKHLEEIPSQYGSIYSQLSLKLVGLAKNKHPNSDYSELIQTIETYMHNSKNVDSANIQYKEDLT